MGLWTAIKKDQARKILGNIHVDINDRKKAIETLPTSDDGLLYAMKFIVSEEAKDAFSSVLIRVILEKMAKTNSECYKFIEDILDDVVKPEDFEAIIRNINKDEPEGIGIMLNVLKRLDEVINDSINNNGGIDRYPLEVEENEDHLFDKKNMLLDRLGEIHDVNLRQEAICEAVNITSKDIEENNDNRDTEILSNLISMMGVLLMGDSVNATDANKGLLTLLKLALSNKKAADIALDRFFMLSTPKNTNKAIMTLISERAEKPIIRAKAKLSITSETSKDDIIALLKNSNITIAKLTITKIRSTGDIEVFNDMLCEAMKKTIHPEIVEEAIKATKGIRTSIVKSSATKERKRKLVETLVKVAKGYTNYSDGIQSLATMEKISKLAVKAIVESKTKNQDGILADIARNGRVNEARTSAMGYIDKTKKAGKQRVISILAKDDINVKDADQDTILNLESVELFKPVIEGVIRVKTTPVILKTKPKSATPPTPAAK